MAVAELSPEAVEETAALEPEAGSGPEETPSVFSVVNRHIVGRADVSPAFEDGSRTLRLYSANGQTIIEANLSKPLCDFLSGKLVEVEVIEEDDADADAA